MAYLTLGSYAKIVSLSCLDNEPYIAVLLIRCFNVDSFIKLFCKKKIWIVALKPNKDLAYMSELFDAGKIKPIIEGHYNLEEVPNAFRLFAHGGH